MSDAVDVFRSAATRAGGHPALAAESIQSLGPTRGVLVLSGYGLKIMVERGHLAVADGVGPNRRAGLLNRATCGLSRLVVLGHAGIVSLEALRWLSDIGAAFVQLDADGTVVAAFAPLGSDDPRLRRAQVLASVNGVGLELVRALLREKLAGQAALLPRLPGGDAAKSLLAMAQSRLEEAQTPAELRLAESQGALAYWSAWSAVPLRVAKKDDAKFPAHWITFGGRSSPLTNQPRLAANPVNALLNYGYAILEAEARIACLTVGLDPGLGLLHADQKNRDSLALDLMEPVRPKVDALILDLLARRVFSFKDCFETPQGNCRLMPTVTVPLAEHAPQFAKWIAPHVERLARDLAQAKQPSTATMPTPLTQSNRSAGRDGIRVGERKAGREQSAVLPTACKACGTILEEAERVWCPACQPVERTAKDHDNLANANRNLIQARAAGQDPAHGKEAARKRAATQLAQQRLNREWEASNQPMTTVAEYRERILPGLAGLSLGVIAQALGVSVGYAGQVRKGVKVPHPRHWAALNEIQCEWSKAC